MLDKICYSSPARCAIWVFALVMLSVFIVEDAIMFIMPKLPTWMRIPAIEGLSDATVLTLVTAPVIWWLAVVPIRRLAAARGELLHRLFRAQEDERSRIARDLHDEIGQHLTSLLVGLKVIDTAPDLETARARAGELRELGAVAHEEVRRLAAGLRSGVLEELGLAAAIESMCRDYERTHGTTVHLNMSPEAFDDLNVAAETSLFRILQETLTNAARHAGAVEIDVALLQVGDVVTLSIHDDGRGFRADETREAADESPSIGLASIHERALMLGGKCHIRSEAGRGTTVQVTIPIAGNHNDNDSRIHRR